MRNNDQKVYLYLTGGLGNQLFQYSALLCMNYASEKFVLSNLGHPRRNQQDQPEIYSLLGEFIRFKNLVSPSNQLLEKIVGLNLRLSVGKMNKGKSAFRFFIRFLSNISISLLTKRFIRVIFDPESKPNILFTHSLLIGYFQSSKYAGKLSELALESHPTENIELTRLAVKAQIQKPLVIHLRRGDYAAEKDFGVLDPTYYEEAFNEFVNTKESSLCKSIWIFSDEIEYARKVLKFDTELSLEWFSEVGGTTVNTLLAMSLGSNFIIANSTFSWWAAQLSSDASKVYYPLNWFKNLYFNPSLFPSEWRGINNRFSTD